MPRHAKGTGSPAMRPSRRRRRRLLRMRDFLNAIKDFSHAEEPPQAASRSTHGVLAARSFCTVRRRLKVMHRHFYSLVLTAAVAATALTAPAAADEEPKRGGTLTYMIPADAPPSFDAHREETYATIHSAAPFYSVLIRANPYDPGKTDDLVCDLCTAMPKPTDGGKTYTFKIREGVKFTDGSPLTAEDVAASWNEIIYPLEGVISARQSNFVMVDKVEAADPATVVFRLKFATDAFLPALADPYAWIYKKEILDKDPHWYEKTTPLPAPSNFVT